MTTMRAADTSSKKSKRIMVGLVVGRESSEGINKTNQEKLFETFNATVSKIDCIKAMVHYQATAHLQQASFGVMEINIFHHHIEVGDTLYDQNAK